jgi:excisionase family DNA binding protein
MQDRTSNTPPKIAYSVIEAAAATSLSKSTIWASISAGKLKTHRVGGRVLIPADSLIDFVTGKAA